MKVISYFEVKFHFSKRRKLAIGLNAEKALIGISWFHIIGDIQNWSWTKKVHSYAAIGH
jgi:hypothetical protein